MRKIRISIAQINPVVGDLSGNARKIISYIKKARSLKSELVIFPELAVTGYPPEDLLLKPKFVEDNLTALDTIKSATQDITAIVGFVDSNDVLFNAAAVISDCSLIDVYHKKCLPNYGVFDEFRYFRSGKRFPLYTLSDIQFGVNICEDIWDDRGPMKILTMSGAHLIININASPYYMEKASLREELIKRRVSESNTAIIYVNMVGGQDELVFDGGSFVVDWGGDIIARGSQFNEELITADLSFQKTRRRPSVREKKECKKLMLKGETIDKVKIPSKTIKTQKPKIKLHKKRQLPLLDEVYRALLTGTRDYVHKNGFSNVVIGLSGGIDSALVAAIAVDALGKDSVQGLFMPSAFTSKESHEDVHALADRLRIKLIHIPIHKIFEEYLKALSNNFKDSEFDITEENIQARIRGNLLMAFSNKFGWLVLTTGNKSEMSVGYATLYGDMAGGFAVIKDVQKTMVYDLCKWRNSKKGKEVIPERILWKEPSAELKPDQRDADTLPPYPVLDPILKAYIEDDKGFGEIREMGCDRECTQKVIRMVDQSEYKRRQAPPGIKITKRAFGKDRRFPITNRYKSY
jgi:NAD+ synthase (glutamine-hydrolysing)